jgi:hypothetical protein
MVDLLAGWLVGWLVCLFFISLAGWLGGSTFWLIYIRICEPDKERQRVYPIPTTLLGISAPHNPNIYF